VHAAQRARDHRQVVDHLVTGERRLHPLPHIGREGTVAAAREQRRPPSRASVTVERDHDLDMVEEPGQGTGGRRIDLGGGNVPAQLRRLEHRVQRGPAARGRIARDHICTRLERASVEREEAERRAQLQHLLDAWLAQQLGEHRLDPRCTRRATPTTAAAPAARGTSSLPGTVRP